MPPGFRPNGPDDCEHSFFTADDGKRIAFAYISYYQSINDISFVFSHELIESLTDPFGDAYQVNPTNPSSWNEICDVCCSSGIINGVAVTSYFSTSARACVIPSPPPAPLAAGDYEVDVVRRAPGTKYVQALSGPLRENDSRWSLPEADVCALIQRKLATFHIVVDGTRLNLCVPDWYVQADASDPAIANLESIGEF
jgi:hypothetical protein